MGRSNRAHILIYLTGAISFLATELVYSVSGNQAIFFDEPMYGGSSLSLSITGGCYRFKRKWTGRAVSVQVHPTTSCLMAWRDEDCGGKSIQLTPHSEYNWDLRKIGFDKQIKSVSLCYEISFRHTSVDDGMMNPSSEDDAFSNNGDTVDPKMSTVEINLYDKPKYEGNILTVTTSGACYTFKSKWMGRVSSVELMGKCMTLWDNTNCEGASITLDSSTTKQAKDLSLLGFDKRPKSMRLCQSSLSGNTDGISSSDSGSFETGGVSNEDQFRYPDRSNKEGGSSQSSQFDDSGNDEEMIKVALSEHNKYRRLHGVPDLKWNSKLQRTAQSFADKLARSNQFRHSEDNEYGENLGGISTKDKMSALKQVIRLWYNEIQNYNFNNPSYSVKGLRAGHFTQLVWKETKDIGCGVKWNTRRSWWVIICNYDPAGNFKGQYESNVFPPAKNSREI